MDIYEEEVYNFFTVTIKINNLENFVNIALSENNV